jgi:hypothetical protein
MASGRVDQIPNVDGGAIRVRWRQADVVEGSVDKSAPRTLVWHTTESDGVPPYSEGVAPHFTVPDDEPVLYQHVELGKIGTSLRHEGAPETNRIAVIQVEQVGHSAVAPWAPKEKAQQVLIASLAEFAMQEFDVPKQRAFPDTLETGHMWAVSDNPRRKEAKWGKVAGHFTHLEVTAGNTHWDCGGEQLQSIIDGKVAPEMVSAWQMLAVWRPDDGHVKSRPLTPHVQELERLLRLAGKDEDLVKNITSHEKKKHRIVLVERLVDAEAADEWEEWRDSVIGDK